MFAPMAMRSANHQVRHSLRFRASNTGYLARTPGVALNRKTWTSSRWVKLGALGTNRRIFGVYGGSTDGDFLTTVLNTSDVFAVGGGVTTWRATNAVLRDTAAWYNLVVAVDTTQATANDRIKVYINGVLITSFGTLNNPTLNADLAVGSTAAHSIASSSIPFDGHMARDILVFGQQLAAADFGRFDAVTGAWVPKAFAGSVGTGGHLLDFDNATSTTTIGYDTSGNANHWTTSGISVTAGVTFDQSTDTPTNNYATFNPLAVTPSVTLASANLSAAWSGGSITSTQIATQPVQDGTYFEITVGTNSNSNASLGLLKLGGALNNWLGNTVDGYAFYPAATGTGTRGRCFNNGGSGVVWGKSATGFGLTTYGVYYSGGSLYFRDDTGWMNGSNSNDATPTSAAFTGLSGTFFPAVAQYSAGSQSTQFSLNCGQRPFAYTPPTGFKSLCTQNLPSQAVTLSGSFTGDANADGPVIWTNGNPATLTINGNAVTFGTHADKTAGGFKLRSSSNSYNQAGTNTWTATAGNRFRGANKVPNNAQVNP